MKTREGLRVKKTCLGDLLNGQSACLIWCVKNIANEERGQLEALQELLHHGLEMVVIRPAEGNVGPLQ